MGPLLTQSYYECIQSMMYLVHQVNTVDAVVVTDCVYTLLNITQYLTMNNT